MTAAATPAALPLLNAALFLGAPRVQLLQVLF
jgi:hypothetical protein